MEASQSQPGQSGDGSQVSQETPTTDSNLTTPQADQPVPSEPERTGDGQQTQSEEAQPTDGSTAEANAADAAEPQQAGVQFGDPFRRNGGDLPERDQQAEHDERQAELDAQRREHNERTGGGEIQDGERQAANEEHLAKTAGETPSSDEPQGD